MKKSIVSALVFLLFSQSVFADGTANQNRKNVSITTATYNKFYNFGYYVLFNDNNNIYSIRNQQLLKYSYVNNYDAFPALGYLIVPNKNVAEIIDMDTKGLSLIKRLKFENTVKNVHFSHNVKNFNIVENSGTLHVFDILTFKEIRNFKVGDSNGIIKLSENTYFVANAIKNELHVFNYETGIERKVIKTDDDINSYVFNNDCSQLAIATQNGKVRIYNTSDFKESISLEGLGYATDVDFHKDGKYIAVVTDEKTIKIINLKSIDDQETIEFDNGVEQVRFLTSADGIDQILTKHGNVKDKNAAFTFVNLDNILPYYANMMIDELNSRLDEWAKMRPNESLEEYRSRVNEENRLIQSRLLEQEIATRMAGDLISINIMEVEGYDKSNGILTIGFDNMNDIYLNIPEEEVISFGDLKNIEFRDVVYGLNDEDKFDIIYANVYNKETGKTYTFDNLSRESLSFLKGGDNFVPIELVRQAGMEDVTLQAFKEEIIERAKAENLISDHTHITVNTNVEAATDANGKKITNYNIDFNYTVEAEYSANDDFPTGKYLIEKSNAAISMLSIAKKAFDKDFSQYLKEGKKVVVSITGSADALPIRRTIAYDGAYGEFENVPYYLNSELKTVTINKAGGVTQNEQLAFLRAQGVKSYLEQNIEGFNKMNAEYRTNVEVADKIGGEYRRIHVRFTFVDAF